MIPENISKSAVSFEEFAIKNQWHDLDLKHFAEYAKYLLDNKLAEFVKAQLAFSRDIELPLLKYFENYSDEEMIAIGTIGIAELLTFCAENRTSDYIRISVEKWINNQLTFIAKSQIVAQDITLISLLRRKLFRHFISFYTSDVTLAIKVLEEVDAFTAAMDSTCIETFIEMQQQLFKEAQMLSHIGNWQWDLRTKKLFWSDEIYRIYELELQSSLVSADISFYNHPDDADMVNKNIESSIKNLLPHDFFYRIILKNGKQKVLHAKGEIKLNENGVPIELYGTLQDVTEQKQKEKELEESRKFTEKITDVSPCIITAFNIKTGEYIFLNKGLQTVLGYNPDELYKKGRSFFYTLVHPEDAALVKQKNEEAVASANKQSLPNPENITEFKFRLKHKEGSYRWIQAFVTVFNRDRNNKVQDMLNVSVDVTESHNLSIELAAMNEEIKHKELQHQRMINEVEDYAILLMDKDGFIKNWNKGAEKIKGYSANEIIGKNFRIFYLKEDQDKGLPETLIAEAATSGKANHEGWRLRKDGTTFWGNVVITALHDENNQVTGFTKVTRNLTRRKLAEDQLREYARRIEKRNEELQRANKELDSFTYMASHDLQEPLRKIRTFCNIIVSKKDVSLPTEIVGYFERIITSVTRMQTLIDSLLSYSRASSNEIILEPVKLNKIIDDVKKEMADTIEEKNVVITCADLPVMKVEPSQFHQLFCNLIENAIKYSRENMPAQIKIDSEIFYMQNNKQENVKYYRITVNDNGIGFEQKYAENIFKLFQRLHGRSEYSGTGIGLAICKKIVENHGGNIKAVSEPGNGSTFIIELPENYQRSNDNNFTDEMPVA